MFDPNLSTLIITQQQHQQPYNYISLAQIDRQVTADNPGKKQSNSIEPFTGLFLNYNFNNKFLEKITRLRSLWKQEGWLSPTESASVSAISLKPRSDRVRSHWNSEKKFGPQKTRIMGLPGSEDSRLSKTCISMADARKNGSRVSNYATKWLWVYVLLLEVIKHCPVFSLSIRSSVPPSVCRIHRLPSATT